MLTPYDWQEGIGHRAQYVEAKLAQGAPVLAVSIAEGIVIYTYRRQAQKIYEIYDQLAFAAIGQQSDVEALRVAALDFAHQEGYQRSERDVTLKRVIGALSGPIKRAFADFGSAPVVARSLFAEVGERPDQDAFAVLDYDGDYATLSGSAAIAGSPEITQQITDSLRAIKVDSLSAEKAVDEMRTIWNQALPDATAGDAREESVLLSRDVSRVNRFRLLTP
jgi:proteasome alpha subunit